jgi:hypothetical protein
MEHIHPSLLLLPYAQGISNPGQALVMFWHSIRPVVSLKLLNIIVTSYCGDMLTEMQQLMQHFTCMTCAAQGQTKEEVWSTAIHESGHAVAAWLLNPALHVHKVHAQHRDACWLQQLPN